MSTPNTAQQAIDVAGTRPIFIDQAGLDYQESIGYPLDLGAATGVIVGDDDGYRVYSPNHGTLGELIATIPNPKE